MKSSQALSPEVLRKIVRAQINEVTEYHIYKDLARKVKNETNKTTLNKIASEELEHYRFWMKYSDEVEPLWWKVKLYEIIYRFLGLVFSLKLLESSEMSAHKMYMELSKDIPGAEKIAMDETSHERALLNMLNDRRIVGFGSWLISTNLVLFSLVGLLPALVFLAQSNRNIGVISVIASVVVALADFSNTFFLKNMTPLKRYQLVKSLWRFFSGLLAGIIAAIPFFLIANVHIALAVSLALIVVLSLSINFYSAVISDHSIQKKLGRTALGLIIIPVFAVLIAAAGKAALVL